MRKMVWLLGGAIGIGWLTFMVVAWAPQAQASTAQAWGSGSTLVSHSERGHIYNGVVCGGEVLTIRVIGNGTFSGACVFGDEAGQGLRLARFYTGIRYLYAVSFPGDSHFFEVRNVCNYGQCAYSSATDVYFTGKSLSAWEYGAVAYRQFSKYLVKHFDPAKATTYFEFEPLAPDFSLKAGNTWYAARAMALSDNGKWAVVELKGMGIVRVNTETFETKRFIAPSGQYSYGGDPEYELAISHDGTVAVATGRNGGFAVVALNDHCGDSVVEGMQSQYGYAIVPCQSVSPTFPQGTDAVSYIASPRFDASGGRLGLTMYHTDGTSDRFIFAAKGAVPSSTLDYLALGDSFTSGEGETDDAHYRPLSDELPFRCHVSTRSYPYLVGASWKVSTNSAACSGARTVDILGGASYAGQANALLQLGVSQRLQLQEKAIDTFRSGVVAQSQFVGAYQPHVVSIGVGGNDAGLVGKLTGCLNVGTCEWASDPKKRYATAQEIAAVYPKIIESVRRVQSVSPASKIIVVGYPQIINAASNASCPATIKTLLTIDERRFIQETIHYLNQVVQAAATATAVQFADIEQAFSGHELCGQVDNIAMNGVRFGNDIAPINVLPETYVFGAESFHPTPTGHQLVAQRIISQYPTVAAITQCTSQCDTLVDIPEPSTYWKPLEGVDHFQYVQQRYSNNLLPAAIQRGDTINVHIEPSTFAPNSTVTVELHSEPTILATITTTADGLLQGDVIVPRAIQTGYHTLHLIGTTPSGEEIDVYDSSAVVDDIQKASHIVVENTQPGSQNVTVFPKEDTNKNTILLGGGRCLGHRVHRLHLKDHYRIYPNWG